jgi:hypothetical protein
MENLEIILSSASAAAGLLATSVTFLVKFIKSAKAKKTAENVIKICDAVVPFIEEAEKFVGYGGAAKKEYVLTKANQFAIESGIPFDAELVGEKIEEFVELSKTVNAREKDKSKEVAETVVAEVEGNTRRTTLGFRKERARII